MSLTMIQANALLDNVQTEAEFRALISQLDIASVGRTRLQCAVFSNATPLNFFIRRTASRVRPTKSNQH